MTLKNNKKEKREKLLSEKETEFVIQNSPDDTPIQATGDEESIVKVDNPDDLDSKNH